MSGETEPLIAQQQEHQAARISTLEVEVRHVAEAVGQVAATMDTGFRETREMIEQAQQRTARSSSAIHERLDKQVERGRWNPGLTLAAITCAVLIGGVFVAFVQMTTTPVKENIFRVVSKLDTCDERDRVAIATMASQAAELRCLKEKIAALERSNHANGFSGSN